MGLHSLLAVTPDILCSLTVFVKQGITLTDDRKLAFVTQHPLEATCILDRKDQDGNAVLTRKGYRGGIHDLQILGKHLK